MVSCGTFLLLLLLINCNRVVPSEPRHITASTVIGNPYKVAVRWQPPSHPNGILTGYTIFCIAPNNDVLFMTVGMQSNESYFLGLKPYTVYVCYISCNTSVGEGNVSLSVTVRTDESSKC